MAEEPTVVQESDEGEERALRPGKKPKSKKSKKYCDFAELVESRKEQGLPAAIFTHKCPDPDAISSMMAMSWMLKRAYDLDSTMFYDGEVSHPQNGSMVNLLSPDIKKVTDYKPESHCMHILVDTVPSYAGVGELDVRDRFDVIIDHHRDVPNNFEGILIHKKSGSCAAIVST